jgi:3'(2'), 5'-bisphosphate nucleotidase
MRQVELTHDFAAEVLNIAIQAGEVIMQHYVDLDEGEGCAVNLGHSVKADKSPLTLADLQANAVIVQGLSDLTPGITIVTEEAPLPSDHPWQNGDFWLVDPLDGTKEFIAKSDEFTVNIAFIRNGKAIMGVVVAPALKCAYWAISGLGAYKKIDFEQAVQIQVSAAHDNTKPWRVVASKSHMNEDTAAFITSLSKTELLQAGSSLKFCLVAEGNADLYPRMGLTSEWDTAAAQVVVEAAGGQVLNLEGLPLTYGKRDVLNPFFIVSGSRAYK